MITDLGFLEPVTRMQVQVTFMRMDQPPATPARALPPGWVLENDVRLSLTQYRTLHFGVGRNCCWWMRQVLSDKALASLLATAPIKVGLLREHEHIRGFYELNLGDPQNINLAYFGLLPEAIGLGVGRAFLDGVLRQAWAYGPQSVRVNTCTADHPRALPLYRQMGFEIIRRVDEEWDVPDRLGLDIPAHLRC
ncbi:MAG: GNAT family N-acetyltransferase [Acetobacter sp.]|jgi:ribosomal protein S18 acetylase RimI-like enzyme|uniref:Ribosomal protein S18 acetylase RimI-like enzyme n=1 Tax=Acetobacter lovaniensis TaxID=104100 RepID=A0A841QBH4_9PROT|nr:GNAT family N-acetyltransferase [Acetobacter lovaniensis]MBB6455746.1 ribosomal protein S18 acetylase RimI-like enzyme [Acetobacter lovaniensis]MCI1697322.1 GNAT family N-acetyltransferase [Acetobacter lovaniensis]MCP1238421.1 GNAT family N-acetyltransferase [Acetobacter lovaniensis]NHN80142.1 GNAT family N-acetyltransferase [Acetobacter lovaniensis]GBQ68197.1 acetyltransferase [Acetobacter lovaniensis NRIC 0474]